jgi:hypothetical protein
MKQIDSPVTKLEGWPFLEWNSMVPKIVVKTTAWTHTKTVATSCVVYIDQLGKRRVGVGVGTLIILVLIN